MLVWLANWWDGVDLWLTQLPFAFQFAIVIVVLAPICLGVAWAIDRAVDLIAARARFGRSTEQEPIAGASAEPTAPEPARREDAPLTRSGEADESDSDRPAPSTVGGRAVERDGS